jgi:hypothetical protein
MHLLAKGVATVQAVTFQSQTRVVAADGTEEGLFPLLAGAQGLAGSGRGVAALLGDSGRASARPEGFLRGTVFIKEQFFVPFEIPQEDLCHGFCDVQKIGDFVDQAHHDWRDFFIRQDSVLTFPLVYFGFNVHVESSSCVIICKWASPFLTSIVVI